MQLYDAIGSFFEKISSNPNDDRRRLDCLGRMNAQNVLGLPFVFCSFPLCLVTFLSFCPFDVLIVLQLMLDLLWRRWFTGSGAIMEQWLKPTMIQLQVGHKLDTIQP
jgi:hypothetical protein